MITFNLKEILQKKGITLTEVHKATGISKNTLSLINTGVSKGIQFDTLNKLLEFLSVDIEDLLVFVSQKEIEALNINFFTDESFLEKEKNDDEHVAISPEDLIPDFDTWKNTSDFKEEFEDMENVILGYCSFFHYKKRIKIEIDYDGLFCNFFAEIAYNIRYIDKKQEKIIINNFMSYTPISLNFSENEAKYELNTFNNFSVITFDIANKLKKINLTSYQKKIIIANLEQNLKKTIPKQVQTVLNSNEINIDTIEFNYLEMDYLNTKGKILRIPF